MSHEGLEQPTTTFRPNVVQVIVEHLLRNTTPKLSMRADAAALLAEQLRATITTALRQARLVAQQEGASVIEPVHLECLVHKLLLDYT